MTIDGLHVTDYADDAEVAADAQSQYCLVETEAPVVNGVEYELLPKPVMVTFTTAAIAATTDGTDAVTLAVEIKNVVSTAGQLPLTGGLGIGLLIAVGLIPLVAAALYAKRANSKVNTEV